MNWGTKTPNKIQTFNPWKKKWKNIRMCAQRWRQPSKNSQKSTCWRRTGTSSWKRGWSSMSTACRKSSTSPWRRNDLIIIILSLPYYCLLSRFHLSPSASQSDFWTDVAILVYASFRDPWEWSDAVLEKSVCWMKLVSIRLYPLSQKQIPLLSRWLMLF